MITYEIQTGANFTQTACVGRKWSNFFLVVNNGLKQYVFFFSLQEELEHLNEASAEINRLELQLDVSKNILSTQLEAPMTEKYGTN